MDIFASAIIAAAGTGKRMNSNTPKQYLMLKNKPVLAHTLEKFEKSRYVREIIVVTGKDDINYVKTEIIGKYGFKKVSQVISGGSERQISVYKGILCTSENSDVIMIHDGVRPFVESSLIDRVAEAALEYDGCVLGVKVKDTIKKCSRSGFVMDTPKRSDLWIAQTPQAFKSNIIREVHKKAADDGFFGTDDATLAEVYGFCVKMYEGSYNNIKLTTPEDLYIGELFIK